MLTLHQNHEKGSPVCLGLSLLNAFDDIKEYLSNPPILMSLTLGKPMLLYVTTLVASLGALFAHHNEEGKEHTLYYLNRNMAGIELNYKPIENICLALIFAL